MLRKLLPILSALLIVLSIMGCSMKKDDVKEPEVQTGVTENNGGNEQVADDNTDNTVTNNHDNQSRLEVADVAAQRVIELDEVDNATVIVTDQNAYVAAVLQDDASTEVTSALEEKIAGKVKEADSDINNVYVSLNPDFVERMTEYGQKINEGQPVEGLFEEFTESVQRVFPDAH